MGNRHHPDAREKHSILPLLRAIRGEAQTRTLDPDQRHALIGVQLEALRNQPTFWHDVARGERVLNQYRETGLAGRLRRIEQRLADLEART